MEIKENLFDLSKEQEETSKMVYDGKIVKCLVAPYHNYEKLEKVIPFTKTTYLYPERDLSLEQMTKLVSMIVASKSKEEFRIVTANQNIILDMADACVRVLTEDGRVLPSPCKTFMANIHTIRYELLENDAHRISKEERTRAKKTIDELIEKIQKGGKVTKKQYDKIIEDCDMIGEDLIREKLKEMAQEKFTIK
jgi:hypothetical protein